ncbi:MAG: hypothetical protein ABW352_19885 [Polyangiales bacterium]
MSAVRLAWCALVIVGCAEPPEEVTIESSDPIGKNESELSVSDTFTNVPPLQLCATLSDTYDYAPWAKEFVGNARCIRHTTVVPEMGFGTDNETSASFPEFTGLNIAASGEDTPAQKCRKAGIRVSVRWNGNQQVWNYEVPAVPKFGSVISTNAGTSLELAQQEAQPLAPSNGDLTLVRLQRVSSCVAKHVSGLGGHGPGQFVITTTPFTGQPVLYPGLSALRPMTSRVEAVF